MNNVKKTIGWCDYTWNPVKGLCPEGCEYCYARGIYKHFGMNPKIRLSYKTMLEKPPRKAGRIFVGSTIDLFHQKTFRYIFCIIRYIQNYPNHTFIILSKCIQEFQNNFNLLFPRNLWLGVSITEPKDYWRIKVLNKYSPGKRIISCEPLLKPCNDMPLDGIDWLIIGGLDRGARHEEEWITKLVDLAKAKNIPVYIKHNAKYKPEPRKQFPKE